MSKNTLYLECYEGITGEMVLGALKDLAEALETEEKDRISFPKEREHTEIRFSKEKRKIPICFSALFYCLIFTVTRSIRPQLFCSPEPMKESPF